MSIFDFLSWVLAILFALVITTVVLIFLQGIIRGINGYFEQERNDKKDDTKT